MNRGIKKNIESGELFHHPMLEKITRIGSKTAIVYYGAIWVFLMANAQIETAIVWKAVFLYYISAIVFWTLFEYIAHRFLFHFNSKIPLFKKINRAIHGIHHEYPRDTERLIMPAIPGTIIILVLFFLFRIFLGPNTYLFMAGFINGWAIYVSIHYLVHAYKPIKGLKFLWSHHAKHHFQNEHKAYGVSSPIWDIIFRTMPD